MESSAKHFFHMSKKTTGGKGAAVSILNWINVGRPPFARRLLLLRDLPLEFLPESRIGLPPVGAPSFRKQTLHLLEEPLPGRAVFIGQDVLEEGNQGSKPVLG